MKNMKVSVKLILSFLIVIVLSVIVGILGIYGMSTMNQAGSDMYDYNVGSIMALGDLRENLALQRNDLRDMFLSDDDPERVRQMINEIKELGKQAEASFALYETTIKDTSEESDYFTAKDTWFGAFVDMKNKVFALVEQGEFDEAYATFRGVINDISVITNGLNSAAQRNNAAASQSNAGMDSTYRILSIVMISAIVLAVAVALILAFYISSLISKPLALISAFMHKAGTTGDLTLLPEDIENINKQSQVRDEIGQCIASTAVFIQNVVKASKSLEVVARGDLTEDIRILSERDVIGSSLRDMDDKLNSMFGEINSATAQINTGSQQIADGAQALAQGSTEQAATVEQLSASISDISEQTKGNTELAKRSASLAGTIKQDAERGSRQMQEMMAAVNDINQASQSISKVIKVIDDIAFQTNILALNAAVEAARAGQHGKGFAVVAEEVRNLAAKSAEAAKDTGELISDSIEKAGLGTRIAGETAASLEGIVSGINESSQIADEIAASSERQYSSISQINDGINQVAQVVQQNSATAEESAAASEELSGQSQMLSELVSHFKLKSDSALRSAAAHERIPRAGHNVSSKKAGFAISKGMHNKY